MQCGVSCSHPATKTCSLHNSQDIFHLQCQHVFCHLASQTQEDCSRITEFSPRHVFFPLTRHICMQGGYLSRFPNPNENAFRVECANLPGELPELPNLQHMAWEHLPRKCVREEHPGSKNYHRRLLCCILTTLIPMSLNAIFAHSTLEV